MLSCALAGEATVVVEHLRDLGPVNRLLFGGNLEAMPLADAQGPAMTGGGVWDPVKREPVAAVLAALRQAGVTTLRYPGGCWVHHWDWGRAVGPLAQRPQVAFGLPEFLRVCAELKAVPVITLADFLPAARDPRHHADLLEYLNAVVGANPTGGEDAATLRASDGRREPWGVRFVEYGNESFHGGHVDFGQLFASQVERLTPERYAERFRSVRSALKAVDPTVQVGAVLDNDLSDPWTEWTRVVLAGTAREADFLITHWYYPSVGDADAATLPLPGMFRTAFAAPRQIESRMRALRQLIRENAGRDVPLMISEYNANFSLREPALRFSLGAAVAAVDLLRVMQDPALGINAAHYWQSVDGYWGGLRTAGGLRRRPMHLALELMAKHLGERQVGTTVTCGSYDHDGGWGVDPGRGDPAEFALLGDPRAAGSAWTRSQSAGAETTIVDGELRVRVDGATRDYFGASIVIGVERADTWRVSAEVRTTGFTTSGVQLQVGDVRGWDATKSVVLSDALRAGEWTRLSVDYVPLHDTNALLITPRRRAASEAGTFQVRNLTIQRIQRRSPGRMPELSVFATTRGNGAAQRTAVVLINRRLDGVLTVRLPGLSASGATAEVLSGPSPMASNESDDQVRVTPVAVRSVEGGLMLDLPPHAVVVVSATTR